MAVRKRQKRARKPPPIEASSLQLNPKARRPYSWLPIVSSLVRDRFCFRPFFSREFRRFTPKKWLNIEELVQNLSCGQLKSCSWLEDLLRKELEEIGKRWRKTRVRRILNDCVPPLKAVPYEVMIKQTVTFQQLRVFISRCLSFVIPPDFIGSANLHALIDDFAKAIFEANTRVPLDLKGAAAKLKISEIRWIKKCRIQPLQVLLVQDSVRFLFHFVLGCVVSVMKFIEINSVRGATTLYRYDVWTKLEEKGLMDYMRLQRCESVALQRGSDEEIAGEMRFQVRLHGLRPIVRISDKSRIVRHKQTNAVLRYLIDSNRSAKCHSAPLSRFPKLFVDYRNRVSSTPVYIFTGDVSDCFPNINHSEMRRVIDVLSRNVSKFFVASDAFPWLRYAAGLTHQEAMNRLKKGGNGCITSNAIDKQVLIESLDLEPLIKYRDRFLRPRRGIGQGYHTSASLCELYLAAIERKSIENFVNPQNTFVYRYADDYLIISTNLEEIKEVIYRLMYALTESGLTMKHEKMSMNFNFGGQVTQETTRFRWCGFEFWDDLRIDIDVERLKKRPLHIPVLSGESVISRRRRLASRMKTIFLKKLEALKMCARTREERNRCNDRIASVAMKTVLPKLAKHVRLYGVHRGTREYLKKLRVWIRSGFNRIVDA
ncbi:hypothetical protein QR680_006577 [Steinernema hermaphroditum]|uniref:Telomerase reverse transcriptase n=1 Tax=Steinernema hermaphroditum TaxID=289476 RepID=A0AA39HVV7_9BILA|nr:hypothetical protein QR680_006577 [Steinernema hermaphroditum]